MLIRAYGLVEGHLEGLDGFFDYEVVRVSLSLSLYIYIHIHT